MNNQTKRIFTLVQDNYVLVVGTSLNSFYDKALEEDVPIKISLSTLRKKLNESKRYHFTDGVRIFWVQKIENKKI